MNNNEILYQLFSMAVVAVVLFFVFRELFTWYWKINQITKSLDRIDENLASVTDLLKYKVESEEKKSNDTEPPEEHVF